MSNENEIDKPQPASNNEPAAEAKAAEPKTAEAKPSEEGAEKPKPVAAKAAAAEKPAAPKKEETPPPPPEPGPYATLLGKLGFSPAPLGKDATGMEMIELKSSEFLNAAVALRDNAEAQFDLLVSVSGVDWKDRLEAVYHLYSTKTFDRLALKVTAVDEKIPSVVSVWQTADWHERETYDLFGIVFEGHPNLERILMPVDWIGHPMRKDYKVEDPRLVWNER